MPFLPNRIACVKYTHNVAATFVTMRLQHSCSMLDYLTLCMVLFSAAEYSLLNIKAHNLIFT
jgi:hypothetical protein